MKKQILISTMAYATLADTFGFSGVGKEDVEEAFTSEAFGEGTSTDKLSGLVASKMGIDPTSPQAIAASLAAVASLDYDKTSEAFTDNGKDLDSTMTVENFSSANPADIQSYNWGFNYGATKQEELLEGFYPTIIQPVGTRAIKLNMEVDYIFDAYSRNDGKSGASKDKAIPFIQTINDIDAVGNRNELIAASDRKVEWDKYFVKDLETDGKDVLTGEAIKIAPFVANTKIALLDLGQTAAEASVGEFDQNTQLAPFPAVTRLLFKAGAEYLAIDTTANPSFSFAETATGDSKDIGLLASTTLVITPSEMKDVKTGAQNTELADIPANYRVVYEVLFQGSGNLRDGYASVHANGLEVIKIVDASGKEVLPTEANYAAMVTAAEKIATTSFVGQDIVSHIVNDDLAREGKRVTLRNKSQNITLEPNSPISVEAPLAKLSGKNKTDDVYIPTLIKLSLVEINNIGMKRLLNRANFLRTNATTFAEAGDSFGVASYMVRPWFESQPLNLATTVDSVRSGERVEDIKAVFDINVKEMVSRMVTESNYVEAIVGTRNVIDIVVGVHSGLAKFIGSTVDMGPGFNVKIVSTNKGQFKNRCLLTVTNFSSTRNTAIDVFSFGAHLYTPVLIGEEGEKKNRTLTVQCVDQHANLCPIMGEFTVTGLRDSLGKVAQNRKTV